MDSDREGMTKDVVGDGGYDYYCVGVMLTMLLTLNMVMVTVTAMILMMVVLIITRMMTVNDDNDDDDDDYDDDDDNAGRPATYLPCAARTRPCVLVLPATWVRILL